MRRSNCSGCGSDDLTAFLDLGLSPVADAYTAQPFEQVDRFPLEVAVCGSCRLTQLLEVVPHDLLFGAGYSFYTSASPPLSSYHERYAADVLARWDLTDALVVEVGCNDGDLLRHFRAVTPRLVGIDPSSGPAAVAVGRGLPTVVEPFGRALADRILDEHGPARLVIANHVLAHVADASDMIAGIATLVAPNGHAMVEVQYLPDLLINNAFDLVYHEHRNFFSLTTLERAVARHGLRVEGARLTDRQGGSLRVILTKEPGCSDQVDRIRSSEGWLENHSAYDGMQGRVERIRTRLLDLLESERRAEGIVAGYGAPAKATTLLNFCGIGSDLVRFATDTTPAKQGRYIPGTGIAICSPDSISIDDVDVFVLLAWNYLSPIIRRHQFRGRWVVPLPVPVVI